MLCTHRVVVVVAVSQMIIVPQLYLQGRRHQASRSPLVFRSTPESAALSIPGVLGMSVQAATPGVSILACLNARVRSCERISASGDTRRLDPRLCFSLDARVSGAKSIPGVLGMSVQAATPGVSILACLNARVSEL